MCHTQHLKPTRPPQHPTSTTPSPSLQHQYFLTGDNSSSESTPYCWKNSVGTWLPATLASFPHTRDVYTDRLGHATTLNESENFDQCIWITSFQPLRHTINPSTSPDGNYTETLSGIMSHEMITWEVGADNHRHVYHDTHPRADDGTSKKV